MKHKYQIVFEFETDRAIKPQRDARLIQFENVLEYFGFVPNLKHHISGCYVYGTGKFKLKKVSK